MERYIDYHDFVFKDKKFIGKFEEMYRYSTEIPWHQDESAYDLVADIDIAILRQFQYDSICDIGCGLGYFTNRLYQELVSIDNGHPKVTAIDISPTAILKAKSLFPEIDFVEIDILGDRPKLNREFNLVVIKENIWYVIHKVSGFFDNVIHLSKKNGFIFISQSFPEVEDYYAKDTFDTPDSLFNFLCKYAKPCHYCIERDWRYAGRPLIHFLGKVEKKI